MALPVGNQSRAGRGQQSSGEEAHQAKPKGHEQRCRVGPRSVPQDSGAHRRHSHTEAVAHVLPTVKTAPFTADVKMSEIAEVELTHYRIELSQKSDSSPGISVPSSPGSKLAKSWIVLTNIPGAVWAVWGRFRLPSPDR